MKRGISVNELYNKKRALLDFTDEWLKGFGKPEQKGSWLVWGPSYNGKTTFVCQLAKYLTSFGKVVYNSLEEGESKSMENAFRRVGMEEARRKIILLDKAPLTEIKQRLAERRPPKFVIMDSVQYAEMHLKDYKQLLADYPNTVFIWVSHEKGKLPEGRMADKIRYDAMVKIRVVGYKAFINSRFNEGASEFIVWKEGTEKYHGAQF